MKQTLLTLGCALLLSLVTLSNGMAEHTHNSQLVRAIKQGAEAIQKDAAIYQKARVNRAVDRMTGDIKKLLKILDRHPCLKAEAEAIQQAFTNLRSARIEGEPWRVDKAVREVAALSIAVTQKGCEEKK